MCGLVGYKPPYGRVPETYAPFNQEPYCANGPMARTVADAALMQTTFSTGIGLKKENNDVAGIGVSWGKPADGTLRDQFTSEVFYRFQLTQFLAVTPDIQLIVDPALNPTVDVLAFFGIRLRAAF